MNLCKFFRCQACKIEQQQVGQGSALPRTAKGSKGALNTCLKRTLHQKTFPIISGANNSAKTPLWTQMCSTLSLEVVPMYNAQSRVSPDLSDNCSFSVLCGIAKYFKRSNFPLAQSLLQLGHLSPYKQILLEREGYTPPSLVYSSIHDNLAFQKMLV